jgi:hypothetical protein
MADLIIRGKIAERLQDVAQRENRPIEAVIETLLNRYEDSENVASPDEQEPWYTEFRAKLYKKARDY